MKSVEEEYWKRGLHDARITDIKWGMLYPDYSQKDYKYNYLKLFVDSEGAIYETDVKEITFYNYYANGEYGKIEDFSDYIGRWWMGDTLKKENGTYIVDIELDFGQRYGNRIYKNMIIRFDMLEVVREQEMQSSTNTE